MPDLTLENDFLSRERMFLGEEAIIMLKSKTVAVFGLGGVGGTCAETLVRAGIGRIFLVDNDIINLSNINRQVIATQKTIGQKKTSAAKSRFYDINPEVQIECFDIFFDKESKEKIPWDKIDYIFDCIDTVSSKVLLAKIAQDRKIKIISSMGTGNKLDPTKFEISDINKTSYCPLARAMRKLLKEAGVNKLNVVYSKEEPINTGERTPGSISFVPPVAGMIMTSYAIREMIGKL